MPRKTLLVLAFLPLLAVLFAPTCTPNPVDRDRITLPGLSGRATVSTDALGVPHVSASTLEDAVRIQGYLHARDRFFQMDLSRRSASGTRAELTGSLDDLFADAAARTIGARPAAERLWALTTARERAILQAYTDGVNAWLGANPLPPEYSELEITQVPPWDPMDIFTLTVGAGVRAFVGDYALSREEPFSELLDTYQTMLGDEAGRALLLDDVARVGPIERAATIPAATGEFPFVACATAPLRTASAVDTAEPKRAIGALRLADRAQTASGGLGGSNAWGVTASRSASHSPLVANDGHELLGAPSEYYEMHIEVLGNPEIEDWNISGTNNPGVPGFNTFQSQHIAAGLTRFTGDFVDIFRDRLVRGDPACQDTAGQPVRLCIASEGALHPVEERSETYLVNSLDGVPDNSLDFTFVVRSIAPEAVKVLSVPFRSFGPVLAVDDRSVVDDASDDPAETGVRTLQYTGLEPTPGLVEGTLQAQLARDVFEFEQALHSGGFEGNWIVADVEGNLAYFVNTEIPLRRDLEEGRIEGEIPFFIRDGSGPANWIRDPARSQGQRLPFLVIPRAEMPRVVNPASGFVTSTNEDPSGSNFDNDVANQCRPSNPDAIYYLGWFDWDNVRAARITHLLRERTEAGLPLSLDDMKRFQGDTYQSDAEQIAPFLLAAFQSALRPDAPPELAAFALDPEIEEAIGRLSAWDFSTPTGIPEGYDTSDVDGVRDPVVTPEEAAQSVAATIFAAWRGYAIRNTLWRALADNGLPRLPDKPGMPAYYVRDLHHLLAQDPFTGVGASGIDFFPEPAALPAFDRRDVTLLQALRDTLDDLASDNYAAAFGNSTDQNDYRWGRLKRTTFRNALGGARSIPPAAGFEDLGPGLPGIARGGSWSLNFAQLGGILSTGSNAFLSIYGAWFRRVTSVGDPLARPDGVLGFASLPGGASGDAASPLYASQLAQWLTVDYHPVPMNRRDVRRAAEKVELFEP